MRHVRRITRRDFLGGATLMLAGCSQGRPPAPPEDGFAGEVRIRAMLAAWNAAEAEGVIAKANGIYIPTGLHFAIAEFGVCPARQIASATDWAGCSVACWRTSGRGLLEVWFLEAIHFPIEAGGVANLPDNLPGSPQWGITVAANSKGTDVLAHELGHTFGLWHNWEDSFADTVSTGPPGCEDRSNLMNYCRTPLAPGVLTPQQIACVRGWACVAPRAAVVTVTGKEAARMRLWKPRFTARTEPVV